MPLSHDRFKLKSQLFDALMSDEWNFNKTDLLLIEFGLAPLDAERRGPSLMAAVAGIGDSQLVEIYALVMGVETSEVEEIIESSADSDNWEPGYARIFLSHSAAHKYFAGQVADELAVVGIHGFVAHDTMAYSQPWQAQIERGLRSMQALVALVHPEFNDSAWCQEEVGWGLGRRVPHFAVRLGADPAGFIGKDQWPNCEGKSAKDVAKVISAWVSAVPELGTAVVDGLLSALRSADSYVVAGAAAERIAAMGSLTNDQFRLLDEIWWSNDQLHGGFLPTKQMEPFYLANSRGWPPPKVDLQPTHVEVDDEPF